MKISNFIVKSKETEAEYPGMPGFFIKLAYLTREELMELRKKCVTTKFNRKTRMPEEDVDSELFQKLYINSVIKGWKGLTLEYLSKLVPIDISKVSNTEEEVDYSEENAIDLMKNSPDFDNWVADLLEDVTNFTKTSKS